jgi:ribonuclease Y
MSFFNNLSGLFGPNSKKKAVLAPKGKKPSIPLKLPKVTPLANKVDATRPGVKPAPITPSAIQPSAQPNAAQTAAATQASLDQIREAQAKAREIIIEAKDEALAIRARAEKNEREIAKNLEEQQRELNRKLDRIDLLLNQIDEREADLQKKRLDLDKAKQELEEARKKALEKLEDIAAYTKEEAKQVLIDNVEKTMHKHMAQIIRQREEEAKEQADEKVQEILADAMKHGATDYVPEYTISTVSLPSEESKGKIIGKSGRNIHAFERVTGVDLDLDTTPTEVRLSCFDPVRREIARISLERLIKDGRIQPTRIEEVVAKVRSEIDKITFEAGKKLCHDVGVYNLPVDLMKMLGKFKYRFSYGQNLIAHTLEETKIGIKLAHELKADVNVVKLGCLLHDIGKVSDEEDGSHVDLGVKIAQKYGMPQAVVDCIAQHHEDEPFSGVEQMLVYIADAVSGARPGARYENYDEYVQRLQKLEEIATAYDGVKQAYAIQAGREIRVLLDPEQSRDDDVTTLATKIRDEIKEKMTYPGTVTVNVSRETRSQAVAT